MPFVRPNTGNAFMQMLLIIKCSDSLFWYAHLIGHAVPLIREIDEGWLSREPTGHTNIVRREDAQVVIIK